PCPSRGGSSTPREGPAGRSPARPQSLLHLVQGIFPRLFFALGLGPPPPFPSLPPSGGAALAFRCPQHGEKGRPLTPAAKTTGAAPGTERLGPRGLRPAPSPWGSGLLPSSSQSRGPLQNPSGRGKAETRRGFKKGGPPSVYDADQFQIWIPFSTSELCRVAKLQVANIQIKLV